MRYLTFSCAFRTALHIGADQPGNALETSAMCVHSDTLFSALCHEALKAGCLEALYESCALGRLALSDLLPYRGETLYLPKPILSIDRADAGDSGVKKIMKRLTHVPLDGFEAFIRGMTPQTLSKLPADTGFGVASVVQCVAIRGGDASKPYAVGAFTFAPDCGLYLIARAESAGEEKLIWRLMNNLGATGIGGRHAVGMGKFDVRETQTPQTLEAMLRDDAAPRQMLLSTALPNGDALYGALEGATYGLSRRGGFVASDRYAGEPVKKRTMYFFQSGSCFARRFPGEIFEVGKGGAHPVWRCGKALWMGVSA